MKIIVAALAALITTSASAEFYDGNMLYQRMTGDSLDKMFALGYVAGAADSANGATYCPAANVTIGQINDMVLRFLANSPESRHFTADHIVISLVSKAWPCARRPA